MLFICVEAVTSAIFPPIMVQIENNVFAQIGLVMIIGLVAKNAILIVEFAKVEYENGATIAEAALAGARLRLRPIVMTSLAFIAGCLPLALASGSGAVARQVLGTGVIGGMVAASGIAIFFIPAGFCLVERITASIRRVDESEKAHPIFGFGGRDGRNLTAMSSFFVNRPIVAIVISLVTLIAGAISVTFLPVSLFPEIVTPETVVTANYTGADALTVERSVAMPIEQQMTGVDNMNYMYSLNSNSGQMVLTVDFDLNTDPNTDQILVQMRQTQASSQLPSAVNNLGVTVQKSLAAPLMVISLYSPDGSRDALFLSNYAYINLNDALTRVRGISNAQISGAGEYAMRLWLKPDQLANLSLSVPDMVNAVQAQNTVNSAGQIGSEPVPNGQEYTYTARAQGRLTTPEEFGEIIVRQQSDGGTVRLKDVARAELGAQTYNTRGRLNGKPAAVVSVYQLPGTNALAAANGVRKLMETLKQRFPAGLDYVISLDTTQPVTAGIREMVKTLVEALGLVILVVYLFLQSWRATLIPLFAVPGVVSWDLYCFSAAWFLD